MFTADIVDQFQTSEPVEGDGVLVARMRTGSAKIRRNGKHVATLQVGVEIPVSEGRPLTLAILVMPVDTDLSYDATQHLEVSGPVARALAELIRTATPFLEDYHAQEDSYSHPF